MEEAPLGTVEPVKATSVSLARPDSPPLPVCRLSFALTLPSEFYKVACVRVCVVGRAGKRRMLLYCLHCRHL